MRAAHLSKPLLGIVLLALATAAPAFAGPIHHYAELLTSSSQSALPGDALIQLDATTDPTNMNLVLDGTTTAGAGLGSGYVTTGSALSFTHSFAPTASVERIIGAVLSIVTIDDSLLDPRENVRITLDDTFFAQGQATLGLFGGAVQAQLFQSDGRATVRVAATRGDLNVVSSLFQVTYAAIDTSGSGGGASTSAVPEPGAALLFSAGIGVVGVATRRRR